MEIARVQSGNIKEKLFRGKVIVVTGPRQVGKTTMIKSIIAEEEHLFLDGDDPLVRTILDTPNTQEIKNLLGAIGWCLSMKANAFRISASP